MDGEQDVHWAAILVESVRVDGKPRQRHIAYIASITKSSIGRVCHHAWFWDEATERLDRLANRISPEDRQHIEAALAAKVHPITQEQYEECSRGVERFRQQGASIAAIWKRRASP